MEDQYQDEAECFRGEDNNLEDWTEESNDCPSSKCLFCDQKFCNQEETFRHCNSTHNFNIVRVKHELDLDCYSYIKLVNYLRKEKPNAIDLESTNGFSTQPWLEGEDYLMPEIQGDDLLCFDIEGDLAKVLPDLVRDDHSGRGDRGRHGEEALPAPISTSDYRRLLAELKASREREAALREKLEAIEGDVKEMRSTAVRLFDVGPKEEAAAAAASRCKAEKSTCNDDDEDSDAYFASYSHWNIHESMLKDAPRTLAYRDSILLNSDLFSGRTVLDVGCGTSVLSMFAARAGASKVFAVDQSKILFKAVEIVRENNLENVIQCIKGRIEDVQLPVEEVDVIVSEWMGYFLLFESMLDSVLWARDRYLNKASGLLLPNRCSMHLGGFESPSATEAKVTFWDDVYGFRMTCMKRDVLADASVESLQPEAIITDVCTVKTLDLMTCQVTDLEFSSDFELRPLRDGQLTGFFGYFETLFDLPNKINLSTSPQSEPTHWHQTLFLLESPVQVFEGKSLTGKLVCKKSRGDVRSLDIMIHFEGKKLRYYLD